MLEAPYPLMETEKMIIMRLLPFLSLLLLLAASCNTDTSGVTITGKLANANGLDIFIDKANIGGANNVLSTTPIATDGSFSLAFPEGLEPGIYQIRVGAQRAAIALEGNDGKVTLNGDVNELGRYGFTVEGSPRAEEIVGIMKNLLTSPVTIDGLSEIIKNTKDPAIGAYVAFQALGRSGAQGLPVHKIALERLPETDPMHATYTQFVRGLEMQYAQQMANEKVRVGEVPPDINLPDPSGKKYKLSDLKGQVVLLDFWASWCGPCRRENPNVVKVYDKYKDKGFTIFSVSLDGIDPRQASGMSAEQLAQANEGQKKRWVDAIQKDGLSWPYHVSELQKWSGMASTSYGVTGIPKTFMLDRDGKIAAIGLRGAEQIEQELLKHL